MCFLKLCVSSTRSFLLKLPACQMNGEPPMATGIIPSFCASGFGSLKKTHQITGKALFQEYEIQFVTPGSTEKLQNIHRICCNGHAFWIQAGIDKDSHLVRYRSVCQIKLLRHLFLQLVHVLPKTSHPLEKKVWTSSSAIPWNKKTDFKSNFSDSGKFQK